MIPGLDGLRAIAFILVFGIHTDYAGFGWIGVQLFFVLSGFLISDILLNMKSTLPTKDYFVKFYGRRFLRIFPLYYFYLFGMLQLTTWLLAHKYRTLYMKLFQSQLPFALAYVYNFYYASSAFEHQKFLEHFWSLSVEEQFYIAWPLLLFLLPQKHLKKFLLGAILLGPILRMGLYLFFQAQPFALMRDNPALGIYPLPFSHIDAFAFGAYISRFEIPKAKQQFFALLALVPVIGIAAQYLGTGQPGTWYDFGYPFSMPNAYQSIWGYSLLNYWFAVTIYAVAREGLFNRFLEIGAMKFLGKISYGLYVYHLAILWFLGRFFNDVVIVDGQLTKPLIAVTGLLATVVVASLSYFLLEKPLLNLKDKYFKVRAHDPVVSKSSPISPS